MRLTVTDHFTGDTQVFGGGEILKDVLYHYPFLRGKNEDLDKLIEKINQSPRYTAETDQEPLAKKVSGGEFLNPHSGGEVRFAQHQLSTKTPLPPKHPAVAHPAMNQSLAKMPGPAHTQAGIKHFESTINHPGSTFHPHLENPGGVEPKAIYKVGNQKYMLKTASGHEGGWNEATSQHLYDSAGIGHLHQRSHISDINHADGTSGHHAVVVHMEPGAEDLSDHLYDKRKALGDKALVQAAKADMSVATGNIKHGAVNKAPIDDTTVPQGNAPVHSDPDLDYMDKNRGNLEKIMMMDMVTGNKDRHYGNIMVKPDGSPLAIDHGYAFGQDHQHAGEGGELEDFDSFHTSTNRPGKVHGNMALAYGKDQQSSPFSKETWDWYDKNKAGIHQAFQQQLEHIPDAGYKQKMLNSFQNRLSHIDTYRRMG